MNLVVFLRNMPCHYVDYLGLLKDLPKPDNQCAKNGSLISFVFDGMTLSGSGFSTDAVSGKPISRTTTYKDGGARLFGVPLILIPETELVFFFF